MVGVEGGSVRVILLIKQTYIAASEVNASADIIPSWGSQMGTKRATFRYYNTTRYSRTRFAFVLNNHCK